MTLKSLLKPALLALSLIPLSACSSLFKPDRMTIEYDEEVKLHDGEMIWVHITRHYGLSSGIFGDPGGMESSYKPTNVEISWDTGFEGVGRKSVFFKESVTIIDKYNDKWYVVGRLPTYAEPEYLNNSINCRLVGVTYKQICIAALNQQGEFVKADVANIDSFNSMNIIHPLGISDWGLVPRPLDGKKITWSEKLSLESKQDERFRRLEIPITILNEKETK